MSSIQRYEFQGTGVRVVIIDGQPWFVAADVCEVLEIGNSRQALVRLAEDEKGVTTTDTLGGAQSVSIVSRSGLYRLIFTSRKPEAEAFRMWVFREVLPSIEDTGTYSVAGAPVAPTTMVEALTLALEQQREIEALRPAAELGNRLLDSGEVFTVTEAASLLYNDGGNIGRTRLFEVMAELGWTFRENGTGDWRPKQHTKEDGYLVLLSATVEKGPRRGQYLQIHVTPAGIEKLMRLRHSIGGN